MKPPGDMGLLQKLRKTNTPKSLSKTVVFERRGQFGTDRTERVLWEIPR
jgi:hypothetical protein